MKSNKIYENIAFTCIYFWAFTCLTDSLIPIGLYLAIPCAFIFSFQTGNNSFKSNRYINQTVILYLWIAFTGLTAVYPEVVPAYLRRLGGVLMLGVAIANLAYNRNNYVKLYLAFVFLLVNALVYAKTHIMTVAFTIGNDRLDDERLNANILATYNTYATLSIYLVGVIIKSVKWNRIFKILFLLCIPLTFILAILTGSRQVLLVQAPLIAMLLYIRYFKNTRITKKIIFIIGALIAIVYFSDSITDQYNNSLLKKRNETNIEDDGRYYLMMHAFEVGNEHPIMGVGPNNYAKFTFNGGFSHCSYAEVYANHGIIGLSIFCYILISFVITQLKRYKKLKENIFLIFAVFGIIFIGYNFLYVFYFDIWLWAFFILIGSHSDFVLNRQKEIYKLNDTLKDEKKSYFT